MLQLDSIFPNPIMNLHPLLTTSMQTLSPFLRFAIHPSVPLGSHGVGGHLGDLY